MADASSIQDPQGAIARRLVADGGYHGWSAGQRSVPSGCREKANPGKPPVNEGRANFAGPYLTAGVCVETAEASLPQQAREEAQARRPWLRQIRWCRAWMSRAAVRVPARLVPDPWCEDLAKLLARGASGSTTDPRPAPHRRSARTVSNDPRWK